MHLSLYQWFVMYATLGLQVAILVVMNRRRLRSSFPFFFNLVIFSMVTLLLEMGLLASSNRHSPLAYVYVYWAAMGVGTILTFAVIYEVFVHILKPYSALVDLGKLLFRWAIVFLALASGLSALAASGPQATKICTAIELLERSCGLMLCGLVLLFVLFENRLGLSWRAPAILIVLGLGFNAVVTLTASLLRSHFPDWVGRLDLVETSVAIAIYAAWCVSFAAPQPARRTAQDSPTRLILQRWNEALMASPLIGRGGEVLAMSAVESFLPGVERTVERVMARKMMH